MASRSALSPDTYVKRLVTASPNLLVPHYLMHSWLYYEADTPLISDKLYDELCTRLASRWEEVEHWHKHVIDRSSLSAGTGYYLKYPNRVEPAALTLRRMFP